MGRAYRRLGDREGHAPVVMVALLVMLTALWPGPAARAAGPEGTMTWATHVTLASRWLDPAETESAITPFMVLYAIHDALVKPMPGGQTSASLAESWTVSPDGLTWEFLLRSGIRFHNGDPVTADDVKFSF
jgi:peptide/nickel transport system substrate-binding protein